MSEAEIIEMLEKLGYDGNRLCSVRSYLSEFARRKSLFCANELDEGDIAAATLMFDMYTKRPPREVK